MRCAFWWRRKPHLAAPLKSMSSCLAAEPKKPPRTPPSGRGRKGQKQTPKQPVLARVQRPSDIKGGEPRQEVPIVWSRLGGCFVFLTTYWLRVLNFVTVEKLIEKTNLKICRVDEVILGYFESVRLCFIVYRACGNRAQDTHRETARTAKLAQTEAPRDMSTKFIGIVSSVAARCRYVGQTSHYSGATKAIGDKFPVLEVLRRLFKRSQTKALH
jgi:hypothetical protein